MPTGRHLLLCAIALVGLTAPVSGAPAAQASDSTGQELGGDRSLVDTPPGRLATASAARQIDCASGSSIPPATSSNGTRLPPRTHGYNETAFRIYWSGDAEVTNGTVNQSQIQNRSAFYGALACKTDLWFAAPPDVSAWNDAELSRYSFGGRKVSVYPDRANPQSNGSLKDAYIEIFTVSPSTIVHGPNSTTRYVHSDGEVKTLLNYRVEPRPTVRRSKYIIRYRTKSVDVDALQLWIGNSTVDTASGSGQPTFQFSGLNATKLNGPTRLKVNGTVNLTMVRTKKFRVNNTVRTNTTTYTQEVSDSRTIAVQDLSVDTVDSELASFRNSSGAVVDVPRRWRSLEFPNARNSVHSRWYFYTRTPSGWDRWARSTSPSAIPQQQINDARPLEVHAVQLTGGPQASLVDNTVTDRSYTGRNGSYRRTRGEFRVTASPGPDVSGSSVGRTVDLPLADDPERPDRVAVRANDSQPSDFKKVIIRGLVRGSSHSTDLGYHTVYVHPLNMTGTVYQQQNGRTAVVTNLQSSAGYRPMRGIIGVKTAGGSKFVNLSKRGSGVGSVSVTLPRTDPSKVKLVYTPPAPWWEQYILTSPRDTAVAQTKTILYPAGDIPLVRDLLALFLGIVLWVGPLGGVLYALDRLTNGKLIGWYSS